MASGGDDCGLGKRDWIKEHKDCFHCTKKKKEISLRDKEQEIPPNLIKATMSAS